MTHDPAPKKPKLSVIEGQAKPEDTRPPVARFGRHTLPEPLVAVRQFVADYGVVPSEELARSAAADPPAEHHVSAERDVPAIKASRGWSKLVVFVVAAALVVAGAVGLRRYLPSPSPAATPPEPRRPAPMPIVAPALPPATTAAPASTPVVKRQSEKEDLARSARPEPQHVRSPKAQVQPARSSSPGEVTLGLDY